MLIAHKSDEMYCLLPPLNDKRMLQGGIPEHKAPFAHEHAEIDELGDIVKELKYDMDDSDDDDES